MWMICLCFELLTVETILLGFQHYILALGTAVMIPSFLVPSMGGNDVSHFLTSILFNYFSLFAILIDWWKWNCLMYSMQIFT